ncbi:hypothetical protein SISNIDRAFT_551043 [Sistotremastrum niveocremeum HHB9708]|uniref:G-protein coupled receptors family 1 profile domain-containing protein n=1 Tax=Sistotremastrum niveocremeum HHB9708 TaxID=1314777 RepID=A0A164S763_9AGAM|nr:hypothetical protein SISNIDRAFT_551043 [Sistotremastrum niveocremeum HHB9708]
MSSSDSQDVPNSSGTFTFGTRLGLVFVVETASLSAVLVTSLLSYFAWQSIKSARRLRKWQWPSHIHIYFISLLCSDLIQAIGGIMDIMWIRDAGVVEGPYCTTQGVFKQMGDVGVALAILAIAVSTWGLIVRRWRGLSSPKFALSVVAAIWLFVILVTTVSIAVHHNKAQPYYGSTKYWCWIRSPTYLRDGIALEYGWLWLTALVNCFLYIPVVITLLQSQRRRPALDSVSTESDRTMQKMAFQMSLYPVIYMITITPISITRFIQFARPTHPPPFAVTAFASIMFSSSGTLNVLLFSITRPALIPRRTPVVEVHSPTTPMSNTIQWRRRNEAADLDEEDQWSMSKIPSPAKDSSSSSGGHF